MENQYTGNWKKTVSAHTMFAISSWTA
jgi:hypothetical protein